MTSAPLRDAPEMPLHVVPVTVHALGVDHGAKAPLLILKECHGERIVPIWIGAAEASAIALHLSGLDVGRPLTHDLLASAVRQLGGRVERILVSGLQGSTYLATVYVERAGSLLELDARPSDAVALALRTGARIDVASALLRDEPEVLALESSLDLETVQPWESEAGEAGGQPDEAGGQPKRPLPGAGTHDPDPAPQSLADYLRSLSPEDLGRYHP
jgi:bifunctional DNase/RNase